MALQVKIRKDGKFRFWTTISDGWLTGWLGRKKAVDFLKSRVIETAQDECEEIEAKFPDGYWGKNGIRISDEVRAKAYNKMLEERLKRYP